ncbi:MAG: acylphosphatase [Nitrososphaerales archaeon]
MESELAFKLKIKGKVQRVGFRRYVLDLAQDLGLNGYVKNLPNGSVEILIQGEKEQLSKFLSMVREPPLPAEVREVEKEETILKPEFKGFKVIYGELGDELQEGFGAMQNIFYMYWKEFKDYREEFREFAKRTDENFKLILEKYGEISEKLTRIMDTLIEESRKTREMLEIIRNDSKETREKLTEALKLLEKAITKGGLSTTHE